MGYRRAMTSDRNGLAGLNLPQDLGQTCLGLGCSHFTHDELAR